MIEMPHFKSFAECDWQLAPSRCVIWRALLPISEKQYCDYYKCLNAEEQARAERFYFDRDRYQSVTARAVLRQLLGNYLQCAPENVQFEKGEHGKPEIIKAQNPRAISFNASHSHECILYAFTIHHLVGIDCEYHKEDRDFSGIGERYFSKMERDDLNTLSHAEKYIGFYNAWTRKEAYIKAIGEGLSHPLDSFDVTLLPNEKPRFRRISKAPETLSQWNLQAFTPALDYFAALAIQKQPVFIDYFSWEHHHS